MKPTHKLCIWLLVDLALSAWLYVMLQKLGQNWNSIVSAIRLNPAPEPVVDFMVFCFKLGCASAASVGLLLSIAIAVTALRISEHVTAHQSIKKTPLDA